MPRTGIPIVILGGSDRRAAELPPSRGGQRPLKGYKGLDIRVGGSPLIELLIRRLRTCPEFDPIMIAGPARVYGALDPSVAVIDTDSTLGDNIKAAIDATLAGSGSGMGSGMVAITACDILPDPEDLRVLLDDFHGQGKCDLWFPFVRLPEDPASLGAFAWKPNYRIAPESGADQVRVLPGHLMILDPRALRMNFIYKLMEIAYHTRNRPVAVRRTSMATRVLFNLLWRDLLHLLSLRVLNLTYTVLANGLGIARKLKADTLSRGELEAAITKITVKRGHRRRFPDRRVLLPLREFCSSHSSQRKDWY